MIREKKTVWVCFNERFIYFSNINKGTKTFSVHVLTSLRWNVDFDQMLPLRKKCFLSFFSKTFSSNTKAVEDGVSTPVTCLMAGLWSLSFCRLKLRVFFAGIYDTHALKEMWTAGVPFWWLYLLKWAFIAEHWGIGSHL